MSVSFHQYQNENVQIILYLESILVFKLKLFYWTWHCDL